MQANAAGTHSVGQDLSVPHPRVEHRRDGLVDDPVLRVDDRVLLEDEQRDNLRRTLSVPPFGGASESA